MTFRFSLAPCSRWPLPSLPWSAPAAAAEFRDEVAMEWMPGGLANDGRRSRDLSYSREFGNGFALGGVVGYDNMHRSQRPTDDRYEKLSIKQGVFCLADAARRRRTAWRLRAAAGR